MMKMFHENQKRRRRRLRSNVEWADEVDEIRNDAIMNQILNDITNHEPVTVSNGKTKTSFVTKSTSSSISPSRLKKKQKWNTTANNNQVSVANTNCSQIQSKTPVISNKTKRRGSWQDSIHGSSRQMLSVNPTSSHQIKNNSNSNMLGQSIFAFHIHKSKLQYFGLVEGCTNKTREHSENVFPVTGQVTELLPVALAYGDWFVNLPDDLNSLVKSSQKQIQSNYVTSKSGFNSCKIKLRHTKFSTLDCIDFANDTLSPHRLNNSYHTSIIYPKWEQTECKIQNSSGSDCSNYTCPNDSKNVNCISLVAFDGFDTTTHAREIGVQLVESVLDSTEVAFRMIKCYQKKHPSMFCILPEFDVNCDDTTLSGSGGFSVVLAHDDDMKKEHALESKCIYHIQVTTNEITRKIVAIDVVFSSTGKFQSNEVVTDRRPNQLTETNIMLFNKSSNGMHKPSQIIYDSREKSAKLEKRRESFMNPLLVDKPCNTSSNPSKVSENNSNELSGNSESSNDSLHTLSLFSSETVDRPASTKATETNVSFNRSGPALARRSTCSSDFTGIRRNMGDSFSPVSRQAHYVESCDFFSAVAELPNNAKKEISALSPRIPKHQPFRSCEGTKAKHGRIAGIARCRTNNFAKIQYETESCQPITQYQSLLGILYGHYNEDSSVLLTAEDCIKWTESIETNGEEESLSFSLCHCLFGGLDSEETVVVDEIAEPVWYIVMYWCSWLVVILLGFPSLLLFFSFLNASNVFSQ